MFKKEKKIPETTGVDSKVQREGVAWDRRFSQRREAQIIIISLLVKQTRMVVALVFHQTLTQMCLWPLA